MQNSVRRRREFSFAVAIVRVEGVITAGSGPIRPFGGKIAYSERVVEHLRRAQDDPSVKAVVLRVDSPGGGVVASDEIYREVVKETFALP